MVETNEYMNILNQAKVEELAAYYGYTQNLAHTDRLTDTNRGWV